MTMILHAGGQIVSRDEVFAVPAPASTATWHPVNHGTVLAKLEETLDQCGYNITRQQLALSHHGDRFFGVIDLASKITESEALVLGLRNSLDKSFPYGLAGGTRTFVCDNLSFTGDLINIRRKHTRNGQLRFGSATLEAITGLDKFIGVEQKRIELFRTTEIDNRQAESLMLRAYEDDVVSSHYLPRIIEEWRRPSHDFGPPTIYRLLQAFTSVLTERASKNPQAFTAQTMKLTALLGSEVRIGFDEPIEVGHNPDFHPIEIGDRNGQEA